MRRLLLAAALTVPLAVGAAAAAPVQAAPLPQASACSGVWVVVDYGSLGGTSTKCATSYSTGAAALKSAGFSIVLDGGFLLKINGKPGSPDINKAYWSYWQATRSEDGTYSNWKYSTLGASASHPTKGNAEGWHYQSLDGGNVPPGAAPPAEDTSTPSPTPSPTKTTTKPSPKPTKSATRSPSASATATATKSASASATASSTPSNTPTPTPTPAATTATPLGADEATPIATDETSPPQDPGSGSPLGALVAGGVVVAGAAGLGGWWLWRGRKP